MTTATTPTPTVPPIPVPPAVAAVPDQRLALDGVTWADYEKLLNVVGNRRLFVTYDRGRVELVSPLWTHDNRGAVIARMVNAISEGLRVPIRGGGSTTFRRPDLDRGIELDKCFYVANELRSAPVRLHD